MLAPGLRREAPLAPALDEAALEQEGLDRVLDRAAIFGQFGADCFDPDRTLGHDRKIAPIKSVEPLVIDAKLRERGGSEWAVDRAMLTDMIAIHDQRSIRHGVHGRVTHAAQKAIGNPRGAA